MPTLAGDIPSRMLLSDVVVWVADLLAYKGFGFDSRAMHAFGGSEM